ncbi:MAG: NHL repeat-containing protein, partial [Thermomicrobiales bacterium]
SGASCATSHDCCHGGSGATVEKKQKKRCLKSGKACSASKKCCQPLSCIAGVCAAAAACDRSTCANGCCAGSSCVRFTSQSASACGKNGAVCVACGSGSQCASGICVAPTATPTPCHLVWNNQTTFGLPGDGLALNPGPTNVVLTADKLTMLVTDQTNSQVTVWTRSATTGSGSTTWTYRTAFGSYDAIDQAAPDKFASPIGIAVSTDGLSAWIADSGNCRVSVWTRPGTTGSNATNWTNQMTFGACGADPDKLSDSLGAIALSPDQLALLICDDSNNRVSVWTRPSTTGSGATDWTFTKTFGELGTNDDQFSRPYGIAISDNGLTVFIAELGNDRVSVWTRPATTGSNATNWTNQTTFGSDTVFSGPAALAISTDGLTLWIVDSSNHRMSVWTRPGTTGSNATAWSQQTTFGAFGGNANQFFSPNGIAVSADGRTAWIADYANHRMSIWTGACQ